VHARNDDEEKRAEKIFKAENAENISTVAQDKVPKPAHA